MILALDELAQGNSAVLDEAASKVRKAHAVQHADGLDSAGNTAESSSQMTASCNDFCGINWKFYVRILRLCARNVVGQSSFCFYDW